MSDEARAREQIAATAASLYTRGLTHGSTGNISVRIGDRVICTPTGESFGALDPAALAVIDLDGVRVDGPAPTKEVPIHLAMYGMRPDDRAVVHLHSTWSVAASCRADVDPDDVLPPLTAYYAMRIGRLPLIEYFPPGAPELGDAVRARATAHHAVLLANHGPVVAGATLDAATDAIEELEATAKLALLLRNVPTRPLTPEQVAALRR